MHAWVIDIHSTVSDQIHFTFHFFDFFPLATHTCLPLIERLGTSPYRTIFSQIHKELPAETLEGIPLPIIFSSVYTAFLPNVQDKNFKDIKHVLSDIPVIKAYHEYIKDFTWFDDLPTKT